jgi:rubrerythrin
VNYLCARGNYAETIPPDAPRYCSPGQCVVGRPFLVAGNERLASMVARGDWYPAAGVGRVAAASSPELREAIHRGWLEQALMEHASVAAFARFSLQLLALGAPAELCSQAARAMQDEIEHARACFEHARRHSDSDGGPGPLDMTGVLDAMDLEAIVLGTIAEGCIGETLAAIEAAEALAHCEDEAARSTLARIAEDETRHLELAWRFVAWALEVGPAALRERARAAFAEAAQADAAPVIPTPLDRQLARHGLIAPALRAEQRRRVLRDVIEPCARALLDLPERSSKGSVDAHDFEDLARA